MSDQYKLTYCYKHYCLYSCVGDSQYLFLLRLFRFYYSSENQQNHLEKYI